MKLSGILHFCVKQHIFRNVRRPLRVRRNWLLARATLTFGRFWNDNYYCFSQKTFYQKSSRPCSKVVFSHKMFFVLSNCSFKNQNPPKVKKQPYSEKAISKYQGQFWAQKKTFDHFWSIWHLLKMFLQNCSFTNQNINLGSISPKQNTIS